MSILNYIEKIKRENEGPRITAQEPRNMYAGGQLVRNTADGSRPGYGDNTKKTAKFVTIDDVKYRRITDRQHPHFNKIAFQGKKDGKPHRFYLTVNEVKERVRTGPKVKGQGTETVKVRNYLEKLPKNSEIVVLDLADELDTNRITIDNVLKEKKFKNKFNMARTANYLTNDAFVIEYANFLDSDYFNTGYDKEFAEYLNDQGFKAAKGKDFTGGSVHQRRIRNNIESGSTLKIRTDKEILAEAKRLKVKNIKDFTPDELRAKVEAGRTYENLKLRMDNDPEFNELVTKKRRLYNKKRYKTLMSTEEGRLHIKELQKNQRAKRILKWGGNPPPNSAEEALWNDFVNSAKKDDRLSFKTRLPKKRTRAIQNGLVLIDNVTDKEITFGKDGKNLINYLNKHKDSFGITGADESLKPYRQKRFIDFDPNLRNNINTALFPNWKPGMASTAIQTQHPEGIGKNPAKASIAFWDDNIDEHTVRKDFEKAWERSKKSQTPLADRKKAFNVFKTDLAKMNIVSKPSMITRHRVFGTELSLDEAIKMAKQEGAVIPRGTFKKAKEFEAYLEALCPKKASGGRIGFVGGGGTACGKDRLKRIMNG